MTFSVLKTAAAWLSLSASWSPFSIGRCEAFVVGPPPAAAAAARPSRTRVFLEDWVAEMIDAEIYRQGHKKEYEEAWMEKNRAAILHSLRGKGDAGGGEGGPSSPSASADGSLAALGGDDAEAFRQHARDVRMAREDPQRYCADRCISTGKRRTKDLFFSAAAVGLVSPSFSWIASEKNPGGGASAMRSLLLSHSFFTAPLSHPPCFHSLRRKLRRVRRLVRFPLFVRKREIAFFILQKASPLPTSRVLPSYH
jgi:hypothetical protein